MFSHVSTYAFSFKFLFIPVDNPWSHPLVMLQTNFFPSSRRNTKRNRLHPAPWTIWMPGDLTFLDCIQPQDDSRRNSGEFACQGKQEMFKNERSVKESFQQTSKYVIKYEPCQVCKCCKSTSLLNVMYSTSLIIMYSTMIKLLQLCL